jgi:hypothetical protein
MGEKRDFSVGSCIAFISRHRRKFVALACLAIPCGSEYYQNITSPPSNQQEQPAIERLKKNTTEYMAVSVGILRHPVSVCVIEGRVENNKNHDRACKNFIFVMSVLDSLSHQ